MIHLCLLSSQVSGPDTAVAVAALVFSGATAKYYSCHCCAAAPLVGPDTAIAVAALVFSGATAKYC